MGILDPNIYTTAASKPPVSADSSWSFPGGSFLETTLGSVLGAATEVAKYKYGLEALKVNSRQGVDPSMQQEPRTQNNGKSLWPQQNNWKNWAVGGAMVIGGLLVAKKVL